MFVPKREERKMYKIFYWPLILIIAIFSLMPLKVHYIFSDILYFFLYKVFRYRSSVVWINISRSFPDDEYHALKKKVKGFYHSLCDIIVEGIWAFTASKESIARRLDFGGCDVLNEAYGAGRNVMVVMGHQGNWELYTGLPDLQGTYGLKMDNSHFFYIYKKMSNRFFDRVLYNIRDRHRSCVLVEMQSIVRKMLKEKTEGGVYYFICDQYPAKSPHVETEFLHQPTKIINGPEHISRKLSLPVVFFDIERVERGKYRSNYIKICDDASKTEEGFVTKEFARLLEEGIYKDPSTWLWSHRRWKK